MVLDAAVLLEAGWHEIVHEVWTTVIPVDEVFAFHCHFFLPEVCLNSVGISPTAQDQPTHSDLLLHFSLQSS